MTVNTMPKRVSFRTMDDSTAEDWAIFDHHHQDFARSIADELLTIIREFGAKTYTGLPLSHLGHALQSATLAQQAGESEEYVVAALLHDIGYFCGPLNHPEVSAAILRPYVSPRLHWVVHHHAVFEGYHFWHVIGGDRHTRDLWWGHPYFEDCARFADIYDQRAFDKNYPTLPLTAFEPIVRRVLERPRADFNAAPPATLTGRAIRRARGLLRRTINRPSGTQAVQ
jgi:predicted HD phosphohydrolase